MILFLKIIFKSSNFPSHRSASSTSHPNEEPVQKGMYPTDHLPSVPSQHKPTDVIEFIDEAEQAAQTPGTADPHFKEAWVKLMADMREDEDDDTEMKDEKAEGA